MTVRYGLAGAALDSGTAPVVDGCGCPWLRYRGRCHSLGPVVMGVGKWPPVRLDGRNGNDGHAT